jgi:hypothetical protein
MKNFVHQERSIVARGIGSYRAWPEIDVERQCGYGEGGLLRFMAW